MSDKQTERRAQIETAAFAVLEKVGYKKASMLQIAKQAKASNETLYAWYGNKQTLFSNLISANAGMVEDALNAAIEGDNNSEDALLAVARLLLQFTATDKAIIINRAAVADVQDTGLLAKAIEENARQVMYRKLESLMGKLAASGQYHFDGTPSEAAQVFVSLVIGELQMQQALGSIAPLTDEEIAKRAKKACAFFGRVYRSA